MAANLMPLRQRTQFTCVAASTSMALAALGLRDCDEDSVNRVLGAAPMKGASWEQVLATAQHYGVRATLTVPATLSQVKAWTDAGKPVLIGWNPEGREWSHASVIFDVQPCPTHGFMVHVADPNCPDPEQTVRIVPKSEFYAKWYEKFPNYLVRRPALMLEREVTPEGRQVMATMKNRSPVLVDTPFTVPVSEAPMSTKQAKSPVPVTQKKDTNAVRGPGIAYRNPVVQQAVTRGWGAGSHQNRTQDVAKGVSRKEKHKGRGDEYMQDHSAKFEEGVSVDPTKNMSEADAAEWKKQNAIHRSEFTASAKGLLPSEVAANRSGKTAGFDRDVLKLMEKARNNTAWAVSELKEAQSRVDSAKKQIKAAADATETALQAAAASARETDSFDRVLFKLMETSRNNASWAVTEMDHAQNRITATTKYVNEAAEASESALQYGAASARTASANHAELLPSEVANKVAKLMSRQEAILKKYVEEAGSRAVDQYDDLPKNVRDALTRVKDQETLWSDAERWLSDNRSRRASVNRADLLPSEAARLRAARYDRGPLSSSEKSDLFEENPEFADMNENPPESVLSVREQMAKQAAARKFRAPF